MGEETCAGCRFWKEINDGAGNGWCRRYPPIADVAFVKSSGMLGYPAQGVAGWDFPTTEPTDWCGEYRPRTPLPVVPALRPDDRCKFCGEPRSRHYPPGHASGYLVCPDDPRSVHAADDFAPPL